MKAYFEAHGCTLNVGESTGIEDGFVFHTVWIDDATPTRLTGIRTA